ncbi:MAG: aminotransferase [Clostridiaceae bacterium]|jgi:dUTP pyrophosphatase|nr:aminotransferase [Clostridiaceae bacterium]
MIDVYVEVIREGVKLPCYANPNDAGMDVCAAEEIIIEPGQTVIIPTGLKFAIPEGYEIQVRPRSGISLKTPLRLSNSPGTIDAGYRDELGIIMNNSSIVSSGENTDEYLGLDSKGNKQGTYIIRKGERIAQLVLAEVPRMNLKLVDSVRDIGTDRGGGFGSTGL